MRLITWNINSVRLRMPLLRKLMVERAPDVICLQETKTPDEHFPLAAIQDEGYEHVHFNGMKGYNGVAIISKLPFEMPEVHSRVGRDDSRHISVRLRTSSRPDPGLDPGEVERSSSPQGDPSATGAGAPFAQDDGYIDLHNLYIPAGGDEPDPEVNDKFAHKLDFVDEMTRWFADRYTNDNPVIAVGDFNIAPGEHDVWSHKQLLKVVSHTPPELERLEKMRASLDWTDSARHFVSEEEKCYSWWSYRNRDWKKSNRGRRLDHIWVTPPLTPALSAHEVLSEARDWEKPSDHAPVIIDFNF